MAGVCVGTLDTTCLACDDNDDCADFPLEGELGECRVAACNTELGVCEIRLAAEGTTCDDENPCTDQDACNELGVCVGSAIANCVLCEDDAGCADVEIDQFGVAVGECFAAVCGPLGTCVVEADEGATCDDENPCTDQDACNELGVCVGTPTPGCVRCDTDPNACADFPVLDDQCQTAVCNTTLGVCEIEDAEDGDECSDGDPCTVGDSCLAGVCTPGTLDETCLACDEDADCATITGLAACKVAVCNESLGICEIEDAEDGTTCANGSCRDGVCVTVSVCPENQPVFCPGRNGHKDKCCPANSECNYSSNGAVNCRKRK